MSRGPATTAAAARAHRIGTMPTSSLAALGAVAACCAWPSAAFDGGLAPLALAAVVAAFVGAPLAGVEWRRADVDPVRSALAELATTTWAAAAMATLAASWRPGGGATAWFVVGTVLAAPFAGAAAGRSPWGRRAAVLAAVAACALAVWPHTMVDATTREVWATPWDVLEPQFQEWRGWGAGAVLTGLVLAGAGTGAWATSRREPGAWRTPWAAPGVGLVVALALAVRAAGGFSAGLGVALPDPVTAVVGASALAVAGPVVARRPLLLAACAAWLWGPAAHALPFVVTVLAPSLSAALLARTAVRAAGVERAAAAGGAVAFAGCVALAGAWPTEASAALAVGVLVVVVFWWVATRLALATPQEAA